MIKKDDVKNVHYTKGGPYFKEYKNCGYAEDWYEEYNNMIKVDLGNEYRIWWW